MSEPISDVDQAQPGVPGYPWYQSVSDSSLEQGDILLDFPIIEILSSYEDLMEGTVDFEQLDSDVIILTQSCDLTAGKIEQVVLCPFFTGEKLSGKFEELGRKNGDQKVQRGLFESLYMLPPCSVDDLFSTPRIVNFRQVQTIPLHVVQGHAWTMPRRVRYCPPYREHLAQAFARFIMRIGFPVDFRL